MAEALAALPIGDFTIRINNRKLAEGFYRGLGLTDTAGVLRNIDKLEKIGADEVSGLLQSELGGRPPQAAQALALAAIRTPDTSFVERVRALGVTHDLLEEGLEELAAVVGGPHRRVPGRRSPISPSPAGSTTTPAPSTRPCWPATNSSAPSAPAAATTPWPPGQPHLPGRGPVDRRDPAAGAVLGRGGHRLTFRAHRGAHRPDPRRRPGRPRRTPPGRCASEASRPRWRSAEKFGKQIKYADRRGIPFVWFTRTEDGQTVHEVKDIRSGEQVTADPQSWMPPLRDLRPQVTGA